MNPIFKLKRSNLVLPLAFCLIALTNAQNAMAFDGEVYFSWSDLMNNQGNVPTTDPWGSSNEAVSFSVGDSAAPNGATLTAAVDPEIQIAQPVQKPVTIVKPVQTVQPIVQPPVQRPVPRPAEIVIPPQYPRPVPIVIPVSNPDAGTSDSDIWPRFPPMCGDGEYCWL